MKLPFNVSGLNFILFEFLTSFPLIWPMLVHEWLLYLILIIQTSPQQLQLSLYSSKKLYPAPISILQPSRFLLLHLLFFLTFLLLCVLILITILSLHSVIFNTGKAKHLQTMVQDSITDTRWNRLLVTYIFLSFLSTFSLLVILFLCRSYTLLAQTNLLLLAISVMVFVTATAKWLQHCKLWNMAVVISIWEEKSGPEALIISTNLNKGSWLRGFAWMLTCFGFWSSQSLVILQLRERLPDKTALDFLEIAGLLCWGKVVQWLASIGYYRDRRRCLIQNVSLEAGDRD